MGRKTIPDQNDLSAPDETLQVFQKHDETLGVETIRLGSGQEACFLAVPAEAQRRRHRGFRPMIAAGPQDRCFPARRPGSADGRLLGASRFVLEEDPGALASSVFFS